MSIRLYMSFCLIAGVLLLLVCHQPSNAQESNTVSLSTGIGFNFAIPFQPLPTGLGSRTATSNTFTLAYKREVGKSYYLSTAIAYDRYAIRTESPFPPGVPGHSINQYNTSLLNVPVLVGKDVFKHFFIESGPTFTYHLDPSEHSFPEDQTGLGWAFAFGADISIQQFHILIKPSFKVNNFTIDDSYDRLTDLGINVGVGYSF